MLDQSGNRTNQTGSLCAFACRILAVALFERSAEINPIDR